MQNYYFNDQVKKVIAQIRIQCSINYEHSERIKNVGKAILYKFENQNREDVIFYCKHCNYSAQSVKKLAGHTKKHRKTNGKTKPITKTRKLKKEPLEIEDSDIFQPKFNQVSAKEQEIFEEEENNSEQEHFKCLN